MHDDGDIELQPLGPTAAVPESEPTLSTLAPAVLAALLLAACELLRRFELPAPTTAQILAATGAGRSRAYELRARLMAWLPTLQRPVGRPPRLPVSAGEPDALAELSRRALAFIMDHPGSVSIGAGHERRHYGGGFRRFVLELRREHPDVDLELFAGALGVPLGTLKDWLRAPRVDGPNRPPTTRHAKNRNPNAAPADESLDPDAQVRDVEIGDAGTDGTNTTASRAGSDAAHIETVLEAYSHWEGAFVDFCNHVQRDLRVPFKRTLIARILRAEGVRLPRRRQGRSPDEEALRQSFETFFAGAQWVGDGSPIDILFEGQRYRFNLELVIDPHTGAFVGLSVRDEEDSNAVTEAFNDGVATTGSKPLALLLDNKPANHAPDVDTALGDTLRMRSTLYRAQNKAHVEGGFGLFQQTVPPLVLDRDEPRENARAFLTIVAQTWARTLNHKPRNDREGKSRVDLYDDSHVSDEQVAAARAALEERVRRQRLAQQSLEARQDPVTRYTLDQAFERLDLEDPERHFRNTLARYALPIILTAIAIFAGKRKAQTLPPGVDARYLLGITRKVAEEREFFAIAEELLQLRLRTRDRMLAHLEAARETELALQRDPARLLDALVDRALLSSRRFDRLFWLRSAADVIISHARGDPSELYADAVRRIHAARTVSHRDRCDAVEYLADQIVELA